MVLIKRITAGVTAFTLAVVMQGASLTAFSEGDVIEADSITKAAIVTEVSTGQVLYEHNSHERLPMASVTKLMCLLMSLFGSPEKWPPARLMLLSARAIVRRSRKKKLICGV